MGTPASRERLALSNSSPDRGWSSRNRRSSRAISSATSDLSISAPAIPQLLDSVPAVGGELDPLRTAPPVTSAIRPRYSLRTDRRLHRGQTEVDSRNG